MCARATPSTYTHLTHTEPPGALRYVVSAAAPPAALLSGLSPPGRPGQELLLRVLNFMTALEVTCAGLGLGLGLGLVRVRVGVGVTVRVRARVRVRVRVKV